MKTETSTKQKTVNGAKGAINGSLSNKDVLLIKEKILHCLADDFKGNQAIFNRKEGWQVFNGTDLEMVMDSVIKGLKFAQAEINSVLSDSLLAFFRWMKENKHRYMFTDENQFVDEFLKTSNLEAQKQVKNNLVLANVIKSVCDKHDWQLIAPNSSRCRKCGAV